MLTTLQTLQNLLRSAIGGAVEIVTVPADPLAQSSVALWVWRIEEDAFQRPLRHDTPAPAALAAPRLHCAVFAPDLGVLAQVRQIVHQNAVLASDTGRIRLQPDSLSAETLLSLFTAAHLAPRACLFYLLHAET